MFRGVIDDMVDSRRAGDDSYDWSRYDLTWIECTMKK
jgi:hypothetical protein